MWGRMSFGPRPRITLPRGSPALHYYMRTILRGLNCAISSRTEVSESDESTLLAWTLLKSTPWSSSIFRASALNYRLPPSLARYRPPMEARMSHIRRFASIGFASLVVAAVATAPIASAQKYPDHPIKLIVPVPPGGGVDILSRAIGSKMAQSMGAAGRGREQSRCERRDRHRGARQVAARRLHDHDGLLGACDQPHLLVEPAVRHEQGFLARSRSSATFR